VGEFSLWNIKKKKRLEIQRNHIRPKKLGSAAKVINPGLKKEYLFGKQSKGKRHLILRKKPKEIQFLNQRLCEGRKTGGESRLSNSGRKPNPLQKWGGQYKVVLRGLTERKIGHKN